ncbi:MAG: hypothetical protein KQH63_17780 [Desulfobulbaceae bacterium]|nr:hypothetical protein [Desulfobulbaceae bacterium]
MKKTYKISLVAGATMLTLAFAGTAMAFHGGGVAHCDGCHSMHNSPENPVAGTPGGQLLKGTDASSTCLNCHDGAGSYHVNSADGSNAKEGGDFYWVTNPYDVVVRGNTKTYGGDNAGHNIVAADFSMNADPVNTQAPGGTYSATLLGCTSCHDAHGQVLDGTKGGSLPISVSGSYDDTVPTGTIAGNYRLLGDSMYEAGNHTADGFAYSNDAPVALTNGSSGAWTRYGTGMSEWCANCHGDYLNSSTKHVAGAGNGILNGFGTNYNSYVATGDFEGVQATAYDDLVPFETGGDKASLITAGQSTAGPVAGAQVMCLTCHRAHASAHNNMGRWDFETELIAESHALESTDVPATAAVYYKDGVVIDVATDYGHYQRSLCNKCHVQD